MKRGAGKWVSKEKRGAIERGEIIDTGEGLKINEHRGLVIQRTNTYEERE